MSRTDRSDLVVGRQAVLELLRSGKPREVLVVLGQKGAIIEEISELAIRKGVPFKTVSRQLFLEYAGGAQGHQGVAALAEPFGYLSLDQLLSGCRNHDRLPLLLLLDHLNDPHNFGSIIRTASAAGALGIVIPERRSVQVTPAVRKAAAGAAELFPVARVINLPRAIEHLKAKGYWVFGVEADGRLPFYRADFSGPLALVFGSEGKGLSPLVRNLCDELLFIPMKGSAGSLNVSVAAAIVIYAAAGRCWGWRA